MEKALCLSPVPPIAKLCAVVIMGVTVLPKVMCHQHSSDLWERVIFQTLDYNSLLANVTILQGIFVGPRPNAKKSRVKCHLVTITGPIVKKQSNLVGLFGLNATLPFTGRLMLYVNIKKKLIPAQQILMKGKGAILLSFPRLLVVFISSIF